MRAVSDLGTMHWKSASALARDAQDLHGYGCAAPGYNRAGLALVVVLG